MRENKEGEQILKVVRHPRRPGAEVSVDGFARPIHQCLSRVGINQNVITLRTLPSPKGIEVAIILRAIQTAVAQHLRVLLPFRVPRALGEESRMDNVDILCLVTRFSRRTSVSSHGSYRRTHLPPPVPCSGLGHRTREERKHLSVGRQL